MGCGSTIRRTLFPEAVPTGASTVAAFRGILSYEEVFAKVPEAKLWLRNTADAWVGPHGYILLYPLSGGRELNVVAMFQMDRVVTQAEEMDISEFQNLYKDWSPVLEENPGPAEEHTDLASAGFATYENMGQRTQGRCAAGRCGSLHAKSYGTSAFVS